MINITNMFSSGESMVGFGIVALCVMVGIGLYLIREK